MKELHLYNTLTRSKERFVPLTPGEVKLYCCGPTVYNLAHIGNLRTYVFEDVLRRVIKACGYKLTHVMNITDVGHLQSDGDEGDDKMSIASKREQKSPWDIAKAYEAEFFRHAGLLNIQRPDIICRATEHVPEMIEMVKTLVDKGYAYVVPLDGSNQCNVYFDTSKFDRYTEFARLRLDQHEQTDRVDEDAHKRNPADFVLWFSQSKFPNQIMKWESPWGVGFPGWHIECSAMASKYLGERIDIHCGGIDHIPVHHTNEIAQAECCHGHKWVNYWLHGEFLNEDSGKMSKSKGEFLTVDTLLREGFDPLDYRYLLLTAHYRGDIKFSYENLASARATYSGLKERVLEWKQTGGAYVPSTAVEDYRAKFWKAACDDLHMPIAMTVLWAVAKADDLTPAQKLNLVEDFDSVFGLKLLDYQRRELSDKQKALLEERSAVRAAKNWAESDRLRDVLLAEGIQVKDSRDGTEWTWVS